MLHYDMAVAVAAVNRNINLCGRNPRDPWSGTQVDLIAGWYQRDVLQVMEDVERYARATSMDCKGLLTSLGPSESNVNPLLSK